MAYFKSFVVNRDSTYLTCVDGCNVLIADVTRPNDRDAELRALLSDVVSPSVKTLSVLKFVDQMPFIRPEGQEDALHLNI